MKLAASLSTVLRYNQPGKLMNKQQLVEQLPALCEQTFNQFLGDHL